MAYKLLRQGGKILRSTVVSGGFSPLDYTPIAWYDSSDVSTITKDISDRVSEWRDKSGMGYHLAQGVDLNKPIYSTTNGIVFDGVNDYLYKVLGTTYNGPKYVFIVFKIYENSPIPNNNVIFQLDISQFLYAAFYDDNGASNNMLYSVQRTNPGVSYPLINISNYNVLLYKFEDYNLEIMENNVLKCGKYDNLTKDMNEIMIGGTPTLNTKIDIKEIIIYNSALTTDQITTVNNYLNTKYNIY